MRSVHRSPLLPLAFAGLCGCATDDAIPVGSQTSAVIAGTVDTDLKYPAVVGIAIPTGTNTGVGWCTGALIAPNLVLTARHCASDMVENSLAATQCDERMGIPPDQNGATIGPDKFKIYNSTFPNTMPTKGPPVAKVLVPPGSDGAPNCGNDLALLELASAWEGVTPVTPRLDGPPVVGETLTVVGYGNDGAVPDSDKVRRFITDAAVDSIGESVTSQGYLRSTDTEWTINKGPCGGDSGGPAFDASGKTIGVMSRGNPTVCTNMVYQRIDHVADWLLSSAVQAATDIGGQPVAWAPQPADMAMAATTAPASGCSMAPTRSTVPGGFLALSLLGWAAWVQRRKSMHRA